MSLASMLSELTACAKEANTIDERATKEALSACRHALADIAYSAMSSIEASPMTSRHASSQDMHGPEAAAPGSDANAPAATAVQQHLIFLVHGIGQQDDFLDDDTMYNWCGGEGSEGSSHDFQRVLDSVLGSSMHHAPLELSVRSVEWHSHAHDAMVGPDELYDAVSPDGVADLRALSKFNVMDLLHYTSATSGQLVVDAVCAALENKFHKFIEEKPGWSGRVSVAAPPLGCTYHIHTQVHACMHTEAPTHAHVQVSLAAHSLGSTICFDLLTHAGSIFEGVYYPRLPCVRARGGGEGEGRG